MRDGWIIKRLDEVCTKFGAGPFGSNMKVSTFVDTGIPVVSGNHMTELELLEKSFNYITEEHANKMQSSIVQRNDVVITKAGTIGQVSLIPENSRFLKYVLSSRQLFVRPNLEQVLPKYLAIYLKYGRGQDQILSNVNRTGVPSLSQAVSFIKNVRIELPPLPEQKRIVDLISSVDSYIEALQQQLESAKRSRSAVLHELLTAGGDGWVETTLGQISKCAGGCAFPDAFQGNKEGIPFIKVSDMNSKDNEKYIKTSNNSVSAEVVDDLRLRIWDKGTVIFPKVGAALLTEKRRILTTKTIFDNNIMGLVPNEGVLSEFLFLLMLQIRFSDHVQPGAVPSIKNSIVEAITVLLPSLDEQKRIVTIVSELDSFIQCTETSMNRTKALRSGLLSQLLSGEHEIPASYDKVIGAA